MVIIKTYLSDCLKLEEVISNSNAELFFVKNSINYISNNLEKNSINSLYYDYVKSIAIDINSLNENCVVKKLESYLKKVHKIVGNKKVCIECNNEKLLFYI